MQSDPQARHSSGAIWLALLAAHVMDGVLAGKQPAHLMLKELTRPLPVKWSGKRLRFGMGDG
ncbi:MAG: hypothetical protein V5B35_04245 [Candidatus Accumulibacter necessarius]